MKAEINIYILLLNNGSVRSLHLQPASSLMQPSIVVGTFTSRRLFNPAVIDAEQWAALNREQRGPKRRSNRSYSETLAALIKWIRPYDLASGLPG